MNKKTLFILLSLMIGSLNFPYMVKESIGASSNSPDLLDLLPSKTTQGSLVVPKFTEKDESIAAKVQHARESDPEWLYHYFLTREIPGKPLPSHEKLGVTKEEYEYFLSSADRTTLKEVWKAELRVLRG